jgi:flavin-dependent dehydrogenase
MTEGWTLVFQRLKGERGMGLKGRYDVVIVGSGPAGAGAAKALSGSGLETLIVERDKLPRYKMCSGIVFPSSRKFIEDNFGELPKSLLCSPEHIKGNRVCATIDSPIMDVPFSVFDEGEDLEEEGFNTWRAELDYWLCSQTDAHLADCCRFDDFEMDGMDYVVRLRHLEQEVSVRTRYLIGADGTLSRVRRTAFPGFGKSVGLLPNYEEIYEGQIDLEPGWLYLFLDRSLTGYFATVFHKDDKIVVVTGVQQRESVKDTFAAFRSHLEKDHGLVVKSEASRHGIVLTDMSARKNHCLGSGQLLLAGEAGGFLRGGEGITSSLVSGKAAGQAVVESTKSGRPAIDHFRDLASEEMETCNGVHAALSDALGFNVFMRE